MLPVGLRKHLLLWVFGVGGILVSACVVWALKDRLDEFGRRNATQETLDRLVAGLRARPADPRWDDARRRQEWLKVARDCLPAEVMQNGHLYDAWNHELRVEFDRLGGVEARSAGPDGRFGTVDDLVAAGAR
jgi:hypothetical protein